MTNILTKKSKRKPPVWKIYNGQIATMRREGHTLQSIGDTVGVTRERVRQILAKHYGEVKSLLLPETKVARIIGCSQPYLSKLRKSGVVNPVKSGVQSFRYNRDEIEKAMLAIQKRCFHCGAPILVKKYCHSCNVERQRYAYPFMSDEQKKKADKASRKWMRDHPERAREIARKAMKKYQEKLRRERMEEQELKFPLDFTKCPNCGSTRKMAETVLNQEKEAKRIIGTDVRAAAHISKSMIADPRIMGLKAPIIISFWDICVDCGTVYCIHAELGTATQTAMPQGPNMRGFGFPQRDPRMS